MSDVRYIAAPEGVAPARNGAYSHVAVASGRVVAVAGQVAFDESGALVGRGDPVAQAEQVFENVRRCLAAAGATFDDVVKLTYFVTDLRSLPEVGAVRDRFIPGEKPPSTAVQVAALALPELLIEIDALAVVAG